MGAMASQITSITIVYSSVYSDADQRKHQSSASLAFVRGIHRKPVNSPHKGPVTRKMFPFDDVIITCIWCTVYNIFISKPTISVACLCRSKQLLNPALVVKYIFHFLPPEFLVLITRMLVTNFLNWFLIGNWLYYQTIRCHFFNIGYQSLRPYRQVSPGSIQTCFLCHSHYWRHTGKRGIDPAFLWRHQQSEKGNQHLEQTIVTVGKRYLPSPTEIM